MSTQRLSAMQNTEDRSLHIHLQNLSEPSVPCRTRSRSLTQGGDGADRHLHPAPAELLCDFWQVRLHPEEGELARSSEVLQAALHRPGSCQYCKRHVATLGARSGRLRLHLDRTEKEFDGQGEMDVVRRRRGVPVLLGTRSAE